MWLWVQSTTRMSQCGKSTKQSENRPIKKEMVDSQLKAPSPAMRYHSHKFSVYYNKNRNPLMLFYMGITVFYHRRFYNVQIKDNHIVHHTQCKAVLSRMKTLLHAFVMIRSCLIDKAKKWVKEEFDFSSTLHLS